MIQKIKAHFHVILFDLIEGCFQQSSKNLSQRRISPSFWKPGIQQPSIGRINVTFMQCQQSMAQKQSQLKGVDKYMNDVDKCDQYLNYYAMGRTSIKWQKTVFFRLLELFVVKAMVIYFHKNPDIALKRQAHRYFSEVLAHEQVQELLDVKENPIMKMLTYPLNANLKYQLD